MEFLSFLSVLWRHRIVVGVCVVLTGILALLAVTELVGPEYTSSAAVVLLAPQNVEDAAGQVKTNPYVSGGSLSVMAGVIAESYKDSSLQREIEGKGGTASYSVEPGDGAGLMTIEVVGSDPVKTQRTLEIVLATFQDKLRSLQLDAGAPNTLLISDSVLRRSDVPTIGQGSRVRALAAICALGLVLAVGLAFVAESRSESRVWRRKPSAIRERDAELSVLDREEMQERKTPPVAEHMDPPHPRIAWPDRPELGGTQLGSGNG